MEDVRAIKGGKSVGLIRKLASVSTAGAIDFRSDKERSARYARTSANEAKRQTKLLAGVLAPTTPAAPTSGAALPEDRIAKIERLVALRNQGILTPEEFDLEKRRILVGN